MSDEKICNSSTNLIDKNESASGWWGFFGFCCFWLVSLIVMLSIYEKYLKAAEKIRQGMIAFLIVAAVCVAIFLIVFILIFSLPFGFSIPGTV